MSTNSATYSPVRVDADVADSADDVASLTDGNVHSVDDELARQAEVHHVDRLVFAESSTSDDEVVWLHVTVDEVLPVYELHPI